MLRSPFAAHLGSKCVWTNFKAPWSIVLSIVSIAVPLKHSWELYEAVVGNGYQWRCYSIHSPFSNSSSILYLVLSIKATMAFKISISGSSYRKKLIYNMSKWLLRERSNISDHCTTMQKNWFLSDWVRQLFYQSLKKLKYKIKKRLIYFFQIWERFGFCETHMKKKWQKVCHMQRAHFKCDNFSFTNWIQKNWQS